MSNFLKPTYIAKNVEALNPEELKAIGIKATVFDVDGTLTSYHADEVDPKVERMLHDLRDSGILLAINSNAYGARVDQLVSLYSDVTDGEVISPASLVRGNEYSRRYSKPSPAMLVETAERFGLDPKDILMTGDQMFKDVAAANHAGAQSLLVPRRGEGDDWAVRSFQRPAEFVLRNLMGLPHKWPDDMVAVEHENA